MKLFCLRTRKSIYQFDRQRLSRKPTTFSRKGAYPLQQSTRESIRSYATTTMLRLSQFCAEQHNTRECKDKAAKNKRICANCIRNNKKGKNFDINHRGTDDKCKTKKEFIDQLDKSHNITCDENELWRRSVDDFASE